MFNLEDVKSEPVVIHNSEFVDFDGTGHAKLTNIPIGAVFVVDDIGNAIRVHSAKNVIYKKDFSGKSKVQVCYRMVIEAKKFVIDSKNYPNGFEVTI